jgi:pyruvate/2-oxoglutarate dehydrogenase complex dihydrolipoamide acyltransferase (E2) component
VITNASAIFMVLTLPDPRLIRAACGLRRGGCLPEFPGIVLARGAYVRAMKTHAIGVLVLGLGLAACNNSNDTAKPATAPKPAAAATAPPAAAPPAAAPPAVGTTPSPTAAPPAHPALTHEECKAFVAQLASCAMKRHDQKLREWVPLAIGANLQYVVDKGDAYLDKAIVEWKRDPEAACTEIESQSADDSILHGLFAEYPDDVRASIGASCASVDKLTDLGFEPVPDVH